MGARLTIDDIEELIEESNYALFGTLTVCVLNLKNGAQVTGQSNVIDPENFDERLGKTIARANAVDKIWELEGYACKTRGFVN